MSCAAASALFPGAVSMLGKRTCNFASVSALQSLTTIFAGKAFARCQPSRRMRAMRPPPMKPRDLFVMMRSFPVWLRWRSGQ